MSLGTYDWNELFQEWDFTDPASDAFKVSETYGLEDELVQQADELHRKIEECFCEWVDQIDPLDAHRQIEFERPSLFLSFNYTSLLEDVYGIPDSSILHIHGKAESGLIFGHGLEIQVEPELDENGDSLRTMYADAENAAKYPLHAFQKKTWEVIHDHLAYFDTLVRLSRIEVLGHSLADVDLPYFKELALRNPLCKWIVYCHTPSDFQNAVPQLGKCGVDESLIVTCDYPSPRMRLKA